MQFALQALPFSRHAQNDMLFGHAPVAHGLTSLPLRSASMRQVRHPVRQARPSAVHGGVRILRNEGQTQGGRLLISGRMADVCAALNRLDFNEYACG
ncbi:hypothetical protein [Comamonas antarctica]|uniref:Uncharacterized protein n=1 Tax=Comamonas antarctica TaxID=2743470 RepID=A0A6N1X118_9BURK|nr:hypothetical protein [Comamonas antarctica]QKV52937.1 hypothetical protein HUK68_08575 [Comamonas antarctica]